MLIKLKQQKVKIWKICLNLLIYTSQKNGVCTYGIRDDSVQIPNEYENNIFYDNKTRFNTTYSNSKEEKVRLYVTIMIRYTWCVFEYFF